jgi:hypothetical protein
MVLASDVMAVGAAMLMSRADCPVRVAERVMALMLTSVRHVGARVAVPVLYVPSVAQCALKVRVVGMMAVVERVPAEVPVRWATAVVGAAATPSLVVLVAAPLMLVPSWGRMTAVAPRVVSPRVMPAVVRAVVVWEIRAHLIEPTHRP